MFELPTGAQLSKGLSAASPLLLSMGQNLLQPPGQRDPNAVNKGMALMLQQGEMQRKAAQQEAMRAAIGQMVGQGAPGAPSAAPGAAPAGGQPPTSLASMITPELAQMLSIMPPEQAMGTLAEMMTRPEARGTSAMQEYDFARAQGFDGTLLDFVNSRAAASRPVTTVTNRIDARSEAPVPTGFQAVRDDAGRLVRYDPVPGGPAAREINAAEQAEIDRLAAEARAAEEAAEFGMRGASTVSEDIGALRDTIMNESALNPVTGIGGIIASYVPGTDRVDAEALKETIVANIGFDRLQQMREASPTGGALGAVSERELSALQAVAGNLDFRQSRSQLIRQLERLDGMYQNIMQKFSAYPGQGGSPPDASPISNRTPAPPVSHNPGAPIPSADLTPSDIMSMPFEQLGNVDVMTVPPSALDALERRLMARQ